MKNNKFAFGKAYNVTVNGEGLDIAQANVEFSIMFEEYSLTLPLKYVKENVFELKIPATLSAMMTKKVDLNFVVTVKKDNLCFEVMKESFDLEYFKVSSVKIEEAVEDELPSAPVIIAEKKEADLIEETPIEPASKEQSLKEVILASLKQNGKPTSSNPSIRKLKDFIKS